MKVGLITFLIVISTCCASLKMHGQCCPFIDEVTVLPQNPTNKDTLYIAVKVTTPTPSKKVFITHNLSNDTLHIKACYGIKNSSATLNYFSDTVKVNPLTDGKYIVRFLASRNPDTTACQDVMLDSNSRIDSITISAPQNIMQLYLDQNIAVYPNPAKDLLQIEGTNPVSVQLQNIQGQLVKSFSGDLKRLDVAGLPAGVYLLRVQAKEGVFVHKLIKE